MKHKYIITIAAAAMTISMSFTALAGVAGAGYNGSAATQNIGVNTQNSQGGTVVTNNGKYFTFPGWLWMNGNCYYFEKAGQKNVGTGWYESGRILKNATTPDGYQVDAEGRWIVDGVIQTNDYGTVKMGMGEQYVGKSKDEVWSLMKGALKSVWSQMYTAEGWEAYSESTNTFIQGNMNPNYNGQSYFTASAGSDNAIRIQIPGHWSNKVRNESLDGNTKSAFATISADIEKTIKAALGDNVGQEFFNYLRAFADANIQETTFPVFDESGNMVVMKVLHKKDGTAWEVDDAGNIIQALPLHNGGVNSEEWVGTAPKIETTVMGMGNGIEKIDLSMWQNRTTDYGKRFSITNDGWITIYFD